ncbi:MAG: hypothetical protein AAFU80_25535 [Pseudomonadota bacterium]
MRSRRLTPAILCLVIIAVGLGCASGQARAAEPSGPVLEIVTYRLKAGIAVEDYLDAAAATEAFLRETGAVTPRYLTVDSHGLWTDVIEWTSLEAARSAEAQAMERPEFLPFFQAADEGTIALRHAKIRWTMAPAGE